MLANIKLNGRTIKVESEVAQELASMRSRLAMEWKLRELLKRCQRAMEIWGAIQVPELHDKKDVDSAMQEISDGGGSLNFIGELRKDIKDVLEK